MPDRPTARARDFTDFALLYAAVGEAMREFCDGAQATRAITAEEAAWFRALLVDFERAFTDWGAAPAPRSRDDCPGDYRDGHLDDYLVALSAHPRLVRLAGHVFLHIAVDLPRVVARSFDEHPALDRATLRAVYLGPASALYVDVLRRRVRGQRLRRLLASTCGGASLETLAHWVQTMRATAWIHAELAHDAALSPRRVDAARIAALHAALPPVRSALALFGTRRTIERFARDAQRRMSETMLALTHAGGPSAEGAGGTGESCGDGGRAARRRRSMDPRRSLAIERGRDPQVAPGSSG